MNEIWKDNFKSHSIRVGFKIGLSRSMCEYLSAVADGVSWNKSFLGAASPEPDNFLATSRSLVLRGLIEAKTKEEVGKELNRMRHHYEWNNFKLTPAGALVVELLKITDMFVEADAAIMKRGRTS